MLGRGRGFDTGIIVALCKTTSEREMEDTVTFGVGRGVCLVSFDAGDVARAVLCDKSIGIFPHSMGVVRIRDLALPCGTGVLCCLPGTVVPVFWAMGIGVGVGVCNLRIFGIGGVVGGVAKFEWRLGFFHGQGARIKGSRRMGRRVQRHAGTVSLD